MSNRTPQYRRYRRVYARVKIQGEWVHLGKYDSPKAKAKYRELLAQWAIASPVVPTADLGVSVAVVLEAYRVYAQAYYGEDPNGRYRHILPTIRTARELFADLLAIEFGPKKLKILRQAFVAEGHTRGHVNACVQRVVGIFRWAAGEELVPGSQVHDLMAVDPLRRGHTKAPEGKTVTSVPQNVVDNTLPELVPVLADMVALQLLAGCRPGELCSLTPGQLDRSSDVWLYRPAQHKTSHHGHDRVIAIGPKAQDILRKYLLRGADEPCFSPKEALAQFMDRQHEQRATPLSCGNKPSPARRKRKLAAVGDRYSVSSYRRAVERACDRAFPAPEEVTGQALLKWRREHRWTPHRLRHTAGTVVREQYGLDGSQAILGHRNARVSEIYSELNTAKAVEIARRLG